MKKSNVINMLIGSILLLVVLTIMFGLLYIYYGAGFLLSLYITCLCVSYHFAMRVAVGEIITVIYRSKEFKYDSFWYQQHKFETKLYAILKVKQWKTKVITAKPEQFDVTNRSMDELLHNMTQAEVVHEIIMVLSFAPVILIKLYGTAEVFVITSVLACLADLIFVIIQRYNRPRIMKLKKRLETR